MKKQRFYIGIAVLVLILIIGLIGWAVFIGRQQQELRKGTENLGYLEGTGGTSSGGGLFGGIFGNSGEDATKKEDEVPKPILRQLYNLPTAGYIKKRSDSIRFVDRATGHVFEKDLPDGSTTRINQTTVPRVHKAVFTEDGAGLVRQYVDEQNRIVSVYGDLTKDGVDNVLLSSEIVQLIPSPDGKQIAYLERTASGSSLVVAAPGGDPKTVIYNSVLRGWNIEWKEDSIFLTQKPSGVLPGSSYSVNVNSKTENLELQQMPGLSTKPSPSSKSLLYSVVQNEGLPILFVKDLVSNTRTSLNVAGFAEKCAWHPINSKVYCALPNEFPDGEYPDIWYQGGVHFSDSLWKIDTKTGITTLVISPAISNGVSLDMVNLRFDAKGDSLFFLNNTDQTLWSVTFPVKDVLETVVNDSDVEL